MKRLLTLALLAGPAWGAEMALTGAEIEALLPTIIASGEATTQTFEANGSTDYVDRGRPSRGRWWVEGDQYCSSWPPAGGKACYDVLRDAETLIWVGDSGTRIRNTIAPR